MEKVLLSVPEVMELTGLGRCVVYDLIRSGQLASVKIGRYRRIPPAAVTEFVARMMEMQS